jgi:hypothetical protein
MPMMFFYFLKNIFDISTSKRSKRYKLHSILAKKKKLKFGQTQVQPQSQTGSKSALKKLRGRLTRYKPVSQEKTRLGCCC